MTVTIDRTAEKRLLARYSAVAVEHVMGEAAKVGAQAGAKVLRAAAPIGVARRLSQYYRRMGLGHGAFRSSVRAAAIRGRHSAISGLQGATIGYVIGPIGRNAFTRGWIELGTRHQRANAWVERTADAALATAKAGSEAVLDLYDRG